VPRLGIAKSLVLGGSTYALLMLMLLLHASVPMPAPVPSVLVLLASVLNGMGGAFLWSAQGSMVILESGSSASGNGKNAGDFWAIFHLSTIVGNAWAFATFSAGGSPALLFGVFLGLVLAGCAVCSQVSTGHRGVSLGGGGGRGRAEPTATELTGARADGAARSDAPALLDGEARSEDPVGHDDKPCSTAREGADADADADADAGAPETSFMRRGAAEVREMCNCNVNHRVTTGWPRQVRQIWALLKRARALTPLLLLGGWLLSYQFGVFPLALRREDVGGFFVVFGVAECAGAVACGRLLGRLSARRYQVASCARAPMKPPRAPTQRGPTPLPRPIAVARTRNGGRHAQPRAAARNRPHRPRRRPDPARPGV
jgi:hypothetical protein